VRVPVNASSASGHGDERLWRHQSGGFIANELDEAEVRAARPAVG
jgi:hypothetical protein